MTRLNQKDLPFRKLFDVRTTDQFRAFAAVSEGRLLYITEEQAGMMPVHCERMFFQLSKEEFRAHAERARKNGKLQKAFDNHWVTPEEIEALCR